MYHYRWSLIQTIGPFVAHFDILYLNLMLTNVLDLPCVVPRGVRGTWMNLIISAVLAGLAFMFSSSILLQILACALYNNWWPLLSALMYVLVPMPCLFFGGGSTQFLTSRDGGGWIGAAKFLTGASTVGSLAIPIILRHAHMIDTGAMFIEFVSFFIFVCTVLCFHRVSLEDDW
ncbi:vacuolar protein sorting-associated protein 55 homolog isoform X1 [Cucurbita pepo subsp. pepo]|uniref:vacuolar protein sorting-associated protein 55 homolog isoform X1 n=1 Tax=Cucurbita pepo subsp. pepo TaxID=3664 RepID=UPI000C9D6DF1|nr:vacuolar protein sorting-associated protein 55 homolog isoform X1 [Cucurbita pepo subsp. pepo]